MSAAVPYQFKTIARREAELRNRLFESDYGLRVQLGADVYNVRIEPGDCLDSRQNSMAAYLELDEGLRFRLDPQAELLAAIVSDIAPFPELLRMPEDIRGAVLEAALERMMEQVDQLAGTPSTIQLLGEASNGDQDTAGESVVLKLIRTRDGFVSFCRLKTDPAGLAWVAGKLAPRKGVASRRFDHLPVAGRIQIGSAVLTLSQIRGLQPFDIVLCSENGSPGDWEIRIRFSGNLSLAGKKVAPEAILIRNVIMKDNEGLANVIEKTNITAGQPSDTAIDDIPIQLVFEVGRTEIPLGNLRRIQPGYTLAMTDMPDVHKPVAIKANGVTVGRGEIVSIDGRLAIRILEFDDDDGGKPVEKPEAATEVNLNDK